MENTQPQKKHTFLITLLIALAIPLTVYVASQRQEIRKRASEEPAPLAPYVDISSPSSGTQLSDNTSVTASILNNAKVIDVEFYLDDKLQGVVKNSPYTFTLSNARVLSSGEHKVTVRAIDDNANVGTKTITVYKQ